MVWSDGIVPELTTPFTYRLKTRRTNNGVMLRTLALDTRITTPNSIHDAVGFDLDTADCSITATLQLDEYSSYTCLCIAEDDHYTLRLSLCISDTVRIVRVHRRYNNSIQVPDASYIRYNESGPPFNSYYLN